METDSIHVYPEVVPVREHVQAVLDGLPGDGWRRVHVSGGDPIAYADPQRLRQIVRNLLTNAARYGGDEVTVELTEHSNAVGILVCDNGAGIPEGEQERIFEAYHRAHEIAGQPASVGLGLFLARRLAVMMGGTLDYTRRESLSCFHLVVPRAV
jgi:signal transduction histidine kinase